MSHRSKPVTRRTILSRRDLMPAADRERASAAIAARVLPLLPEGLVAIYAPKSSEVDTSAIATALGDRAVYPRVGDGLVLAFAPGPLAPGQFGLREPTGEAIALADIAAFVVPGVAFDRDGGRLGWGRGYYDATLAQTHARTIGLAFECQLVEHVARDAHDINLEFVVTEVATYGRH